MDYDYNLHKHNQIEKLVRKLKYVRYRNASMADWIKESVKHKVKNKFVNVIKENDRARKVNHVNLFI